MSTQALAWLNAKFLQKVLKQFEGDESLEVQDLAKIPAAEKGDNYGSDIIRATVEYSCNKSGRKVIEKKSLIIKISPIAEGLQKEMIQEIGAFDTEIKMMGTTLAEMKNILNEEGYRLNPRVLYTEIGDPSLLVMEDLATLGYRMAVRQIGLDLDHCILVMRTLAKFHATSVALFEKDPKSMANYQRGMFCHDSPYTLKKFFADSVKILAYEVLDWPELGSSALTYSEKLQKLSKVCYERAIDCCKPKANGFNVLNHGDLWTNNMLFRYNDEGKVIDHMFVDFQMSLWSSPAVDILRFINTSTSEDVDLHHRSALLKEYLNILTKTMSGLQCTTKQPSMADLEMILMEYDLLALIASTGSLRFLLLDKSDVKSFDELIQHGDGNIDPRQNDRSFRKVILRRLPVWDARGSMDV